MRKYGFADTRWLGVGLAAILSVVTLGLGVTGRLGLYINPESSWFAIGMAVLVLIGTVLSFALPLGAEADHGHDHGSAGARSTRAAAHAHDRDTHDAHAEDAHDEHAHDHDVHKGTDDHAGHSHTVGPLGTVATVVGGVLASTVAVSILVLPPASLSAELAISRDVGAPPLFAGQDVVALASTGDTSQFGIGDWAAVFATATNPDAFDGDAITLTGFVTPGGSDGFQLTRLIITHCVIDAQPASLPVEATGSIPATGGWVTVTGTVRSNSDGALQIDAQSVQAVEEPKDPYEY
ncbi:TIGR03943 family protein [Microbacterium sp. 1P10UB]|uniref:TIGR03943 family putative permease subunit n=1 Tax=unclassified Microbacterium TaxID=2609290 RepID=UPI0039A1D2AF